LIELQKQRIKEGIEPMLCLPEWEEFTQEERSIAINRLESVEL